MAEITGSVGKKGQNFSADVLLVQKLLNQKLNATSGVVPLKENGDFGEPMLKAIEYFQKKVVGLAIADGRIDVGGKTWKKLSDSTSKTALKQLVANSPNYYRYSSSDRQYGTEKALSSLYTLAKRMKDSCGVTIGIGDISFADGKLMPPHGSHRKGVDVDIRPLRKDKKSLPVSITQKKDYDAALTKKLVEFARRDPNLASILFNDTSITGVKSHTGHDNHLHLRFKQ